MRHAGGQVRQYIVHGNAHAADTRFAASFSGLNRDYLLVVIHSNPMVETSPKRSIFRCNFVISFRLVFCSFLFPLR